MRTHPRGGGRFDAIHTQSHLLFHFSGVPTAQHLITMFAIASLTAAGCGGDASTSTSRDLPLTAAPGAAAGNGGLHGTPHGSGAG